MATSGGYREHLQKLIECAVCMEPSTDPRRLPCGHSFCFDCLQGLWTASQPTSRVRCPNCRKEHWLGYHGPTTLPKDFIFEQIREMVAQEIGPNKQGRCDFCPVTFSKTDVFYYCFDCDSISCKDCSGKHRCQRGQSTSVKKMDFQYSMICKNHPHPVRFICETCENMLCKKCQRQGICEGHELFDIFKGIIITEDDTQPRASGSQPTSPTDASLQTKLAKLGYPGPELSQKYGLSSKAGALGESPMPGTSKGGFPSSGVSSKEVTPKLGVSHNSGLSLRETSAQVISEQASSSRLSVGEISIASSSFYIDEIQSPVTSPEPTTPEVTVTEVIDIIDPALEGPSLPWHKDLDVKARALTVLPNGHVVILTETSVLLFTNRGSEIPSTGSKVKLEDARHLVYWEQKDALVVTERTAKRISVLKKDGTRFVKQIPVKSKRSSGLFSCASRQSSEIKDCGPYDISKTPDGGFVVTTASTTEDSVTHQYDVIVYNSRFKSIYRWQCELAPLSVMCDEESLLYFPQWHCILVYKIDGTKMYQFGDKPSLFQPLCVQPLSDKRHLLVAHRKSYICDDFAIWQISQWDYDGRRKGHLVEISEVDDGAVVGIAVHSDYLAVATENFVKCFNLDDLQVIL